MFTNCEIHSNKVALAITEHCTLKCKQCMAFIPYIEKPHELTVQEFMKIVDRYFQIVSSVGTFCITGGEPLMHRALATMLGYMPKFFSQIRDTLDLITNGTLEMNDGILDFYRRYPEKTSVASCAYCFGLANNTPRCTLAEQL